MLYSFLPSWIWTFYTSQEICIYIRSGLTATYATVAQVSQCRNSWYFVVNKSVISNCFSKFPSKCNEILLIRWLFSISTYQNVRITNEMYLRMRKRIHTTFFRFFQDVKPTKFYKMVLWTPPSWKFQDGCQTVVYLLPRRRQIIVLFRFNVERITFEK